MKKYLFLLLYTAVLFSACSSYEYYSVSNKSLSQQNYQTFAWIPEGQSKTNTIFNNDVATDRIVDAASAELEKRGLKLDVTNPDILVRYTAVVNKETKHYNDPVYYNPPARLSPRIAYYKGRAYRYYSYYDPMPVYVGTQARKMVVKEDSVMIDLIDRKTRKLIWRGWAEGPAENAEKAINDLPTVVSNIFKKLN